jgi:uncharacterized protein (DUF433 family)/DNA-binding transcriptional MerR regulator
METPIYGTVEAARYLRVPYQTLRYWIFQNPIIKPASASPPRLSFMNLLECHMISFMRSNHRITIPKVRAALQTLARIHTHKHPLVDQQFETDQVDLFIRELGDEVVNLCHGGQLVLKEILGVHLQRIVMDSTGIYRFFPFIEERKENEPKSITISPAVSFGKPVISGTGISTSIIASRFHARESVVALSKEYGRTVKEIEEAIRWESRAIAA